MNFDALLDRATNGPFWLRKPELADIVAEAIHYRDVKTYDLLAFTIMPNHVHLVIALARNDISLHKILQSLKRHTARQCNRSLGRTGPFWQHESYDHIVRDENELERILHYVIENPVKAGLCKKWNEWRWTYIKEGLIDI